MGWLAGYENDIFISYAHDDNKPHPGAKKGWVDYLEDPLRDLVQGMLGKNPRGERVRVFRDSRLRKFGGFDEQLAKMLKESAVLVCVISPGYLTSEWCQWELQEFLKLGRQDKILKAVLWPVENEPEEIQRTIDSRFYSTDESSGKHTQLRPHIVPKHVSKFVRRLEDLAQNIAELIKKLQREETTIPSGADKSAASLNAGRVEVIASPQITVYLAETTPDLARERTGIKSELLQFDYRVLPDQPLPEDTRESIEAIKAWLQQAKLSVHLFGKKYGSRPDGEDRSIPHIQYDLAAEVKKEQLIWLPKDLAPEGDLQRQFIEKVQKNSRDWLDNKLEDFKSEVLKRLKPADNADIDATSDQTVNVCLFYHEDDQANILPIISHLTMHELFEVKLAREAVASPKQCKEMIEASDAVLLYFGKSSYHWMVNLLKQIIRFTALPRPKPLLARAVYSTDPKTEEKLSLVWDDPLIIHNYEKFNPDVLAPFIGRIRAAKGGAQ